MATISGVTMLSLEDSHRASGRCHPVYVRTPKKIETLCSVDGYPYNGDEKSENGGKKVSLSGMNCCGACMAGVVVIAATDGHRSSGLTSSTAETMSPPVAEAVAHYNAVRVSHIPHLRGTKWRASARSVVRKAALACNLERVCDVTLGERNGLFVRLLLSSLAPFAKARNSGFWRKGCSLVLSRRHDGQWREWRGDESSAPLWRSR